ncbi:ATP-binding protein [Amycolatopsis mongoliensis]|uniref:histidine kinase n=1 Tax=Amycolatopsis mongoliensis TaxID=715475 RepID=A0A9Y2JJM5_9PSEU|nr:ATP-binding protein [Amycolatopsis sp. 4-36]WIX98496.1 ATP-binding protein [Amycolatopsis sp. 4-36]
MSERPPAQHREERESVGRAVIGVLVTAVVAAAIWTWISLSVSGAQGIVVAIAGAFTGIVACVAVFFALRRTDQVAHATGQVQAALAEAGQARELVRSHDGELARLLDETVPDVVRRLRGGTPADSVLAEVPRPADELHQRVLRLLVDEIAVGERRRAAATAACANAAGRLQALATSTLGDLREMENRSSDAMLGDLLKVDHSTAQAGRLADSIAVLTGARSGRRWTKPIRMESILRGALGRIGAYQRVRVHSASGVAVVGYAAEDVMHALAELMDNATKFSAPSEEVHVYVEDLHNGAVITIEDGGLGMKAQALVRAERAVSLDQPLDLTSMSGTRLGLAVVGCLARKHQLHVFFRPSSRGGIGVVMRIPTQLITQPRPEVLPDKEEPAVAWPGPDTSHEVAGDLTDVTELAEPSELPKRSRGQTLTAASRRPPSPTPSTTRAERDTGSRFGAFQQRRSGSAAPSRPTASPADTGEDA